MNNKADLLKIMQAKRMNKENFLKIRNRLKYFGQKVVFTNGCFDILHRGHVEYLAKAAQLGDFLVVGLNSDASVKRQGKGEGRPVNQEDSRAVILSALSFVNAVVVFDEDTPYALIKEIQPDILVKGADYDAEETDPKSKKYIVGSDIVRANNGRVATIDLTEGFSTTGLIDKMKK
jgi:D-glycero-beta-D-manno-heptose 1-phosphate adenylyltransferase